MFLFYSLKLMSLHLDLLINMFYIFFLYKKILPKTLVVRI